jgi:hypothetical protein
VVFAYCDHNIQNTKKIFLIEIILKHKYIFKIEILINVLQNCKIFVEDVSTFVNIDGFRLIKEKEE